MKRILDNDGITTELKLDCRIEKVEYDPEMKQKIKKFPKNNPDAIRFYAMYLKSALKKEID